MKKGWQTKTLGDVCEFQRGLTYSKGDEVDLSDNVVLRAMNIDLASHLLDFSDLKYINDEVQVPESKKVKKGSLIICTASGSKVTSEKSPTLTMTMATHSVDLWECSPRALNSFQSICST